ncbi:MAG: hypothetical protein EBT94_00580 [Alphaproteobacteria bacterium]|jgi:hypothetical protein|nr:hypothetical protein [Alphaproteobacteria bacterium]
MKSTCVNFTELRFTNEAALNRYLDGLDTIWHEGVMKQLSELGLERKSIMRIWNHRDQYKLGILWEYSTPQAYKECQKVISAHILPHAHKFEMVARSLRGVPVVDWRRDDVGFTRNDRAAKQAAADMDSAGDVDNSVT